MSLYFFSLFEVRLLQLRRLLQNLIWLHTIDSLQIEQQQYAYFICMSESQVFRFLQLQMMGSDIQF